MERGGRTTRGTEPRSESHFLTIHARVFVIVYPPTNPINAHNERSFGIQAENCQCDASTNAPNFDSDGTLRVDILLYLSAGEILLGDHTLVSFVLL